MASNNSLNFPSPPSSPADHSTVVIVVVISFSCLFVLGAVLFFIWCLFKRHCKKKFVHERKDVDVDEHLKVQELVLPGPHGPRTMVLSVEDDIHVHKDVREGEVESKVAGKASIVEAGVGSSTHIGHQV